jgi:hypothetical protein
LHSHRDHHRGAAISDSVYEWLRQTRQFGHIELAVYEQIRNCCRTGKTGKLDKVIRNAEKPY